MIGYILVFYVEIDLHILKSVYAKVSAKQKGIKKHLKHLRWSSLQQRLVAGSEAVNQWHGGLRLRYDMVSGFAVK